MSLNESRVKGCLLTVCPIPQHGHDSADPAEAGPPGPCPVSPTLSLPSALGLGSVHQGCLHSDKARSGPHVLLKPGLCPQGGIQHEDCPRTLPETQNMVA